MDIILQPHHPQSPFIFCIATSPAKLLPCMARKQLRFVCSHDQPFLSQRFCGGRQEEKEDYECTGRRDAMLQMAFMSTFWHLSSVSPALASNDTSVDFRVYSDNVNKYKISIPQDWQVGAGENDGIRSITAFFPQQASTSNVSVIISGLGPDFTRLESFGKVEAFAENLVSGLDRSWQRPPGVAAKLMASKAANGLYYIEYTLQKPGESCIRIYSALGISNNGWYNRLYTVTGQFLEEEAENYSSAIEKAVQSFRLI